MKFVVGIFLAAAIALFAHYQWFSAETIRAQVVDINKGEFVSLCLEGVDPLDGCDEYRNEDNIFWLKRDSGRLRSVLGSSVVKGTVYDIKVHGYRFEWFSVRKNIVSVNKIAE